LAFIQSLRLPQAETAIVLGSGLGNFIEAVEIEKELLYKDIPHFPVSTVAGHQGKLLFGKIDGCQVIVMQGRFHYYEGYSMQEVVYPIRLMKLIGIKSLILTNAAGCLNLEWELGDLMLMEDHINLMPSNPLIGKNGDELGPRFPPMNDAYDIGMQEKIIQLATQLQITLRKGVYAAVTGPNYETRAEYRYLRTIGADAVGMSTVPEVIAARHMGMKCMAISVLTDMCNPDKIDTINHEEVIRVAELSGIALGKLLIPFISQMDGQ